VDLFQIVLPLPFLKAIMTHIYIYIHIAYSYLLSSNNSNQRIHLIPNLQAEDLIFNFHSNLSISIGQQLLLQYPR